MVAPSSMARAGTVSRSKGSRSVPPPTGLFPACSLTHIPSQPAVLPGYPDRLVPLLDRLAVVQHQRRRGISPQLLQHITLYLAQQRVHAPRRLAQQRLNPVRRGMPGPVGHGPGVLAPQVGQQPLDQVREHLPRLRPRKQIPKPLREGSQLLSPALNLLPVSRCPSYTDNEQQASRITRTEAVVLDG